MVALVKGISNLFKKQKTIDGPAGPSEGATLKSRFDEILESAFKADDKIDKKASKKAFQKYIPDISGSVSNSTLKSLLKRL